MEILDPNRYSCLGWCVLPSEEEQSDAPRLHVAPQHEYGGPPLSEIDHQYDTTAAMRAYHGLTVKAGRRHITFIDLAKCPNGVMVVLKQSTDVILDSRTDGSGENLIDPTSILQVRDEAMLGNTWCRSEHCAATRMKKPGRSLGHFGDCQRL